jgi:putative DNA primase/helicase
MEHEPLSRTAYKAYADWCDDNKEHAIVERIFSMRLKEMGFEQSRTAEARYWVGLALRVLLQVPPCAPYGW